MQINSRKGIDYLPLRDLLKAGEWRSADLETAQAIRLATGCQETGWMGEENFQLLVDTDDLQSIDRLWLHYSSGQFGLRLQHDIFVEHYRAMLESPEAAELTHDVCWELGWRACGLQLGWRDPSRRAQLTWLSHEELTFSLEAPKGHLPAIGQQLTVEQFYNSGYGIGGDERALEGIMPRFYRALFERV